MNGNNILVISDSLDVAQEMSEVLETKKNNYFIATSVDEAIKLYENSEPKILLFAYKTVDDSQLAYFQILKSAKNVNNESHCSIILCDQENVVKANDKCRQKIFYDYLVIQPKFDRIHINLMIEKALASLAEQGRHVQVREFADTGNKVGEYSNDVKGVISQSSKVKDMTTSSLHTLSEKMKNDAQSLSDRIKKRALESSSQETLNTAIDEEVNNFSKNNIDKNINSSQKQIDGIVNRWGVELTQVQEKHSPNLEKISQLSKSTKKLILVIEDDEVYGDIVCTIINGLGEFEVKLEGCVHHGLTSMVCDRPDLVLLDYELPDANASQLLSKVSQLDAIKRIPVVIQTGHSSREIFNTLLTQGAVDFIVKPANKEIIISKIKKWIR